MATIHFTEAEAARDLHAVLERARSGGQVEIESGSQTFRLSLLAPGGGALPLPRYTEPRLLSEILADLEAHPSTATLDEQFSKDLEEVIRQSQNEGPFDPWASS